MATLGPIIAFLILQPSPILTGGMMIVFSYGNTGLLASLYFFSKMELVSSRVSFRPQSNQLDTLNELNCTPCSIMHSSASVSWNSSCDLILLSILLCRQSYNCVVSLIL